MDQRANAKKDGVFVETDSCVNLSRRVRNRAVRVYSDLRNVKRTDVCTLEHTRINTTCERAEGSGLGGDLLVSTPGKS